MQKFLSLTIALFCCTFFIQSNDSNQIKKDPFRYHTSHNITAGLFISAVFSHKIPGQRPSLISIPAQTLRSQQSVFLNRTLPDGTTVKLQTLSYQDINGETIVEHVSFIPENAVAKRWPTFFGEKPQITSE